MSLDQRHSSGELAEVINRLPFSPEWAEEVYRAAAGADDRHRDMTRVHRDGWTGLARAVREGLGDIADAIRHRR